MEIGGPDSKATDTAAISHEKQVSTFTTGGATSDATGEEINVDMVSDDSFVTENYIRVPRTRSHVGDYEELLRGCRTQGSASVGVLVIEEEDEELWEMYNVEDLGGEDSGEWDSEDADSNGMSKKKFPSSFLLPSIPIAPAADLSENRDCVRKKQQEIWLTFFWLTRNCCD